MKKCVIRICAIFLFALLLFGCKKANEDKPDELSHELSQVDEQVTEEIDSVVSSYDEKPYQARAAKTVSLKTEFKDFQKQPRASAHEKYLNDPTKLASLDFSTEKSPDNVTAVVGSDVCTFYPEAVITSLDDVSTLKSDIRIPLGTVLKLKSCISVDKNGKIVIGEFYKTEYDSVFAKSEEPFAFEDEWNYFYTTEYSGKTGLIFGADLEGELNDEFKNRAMGELYKSDGAPQVFLSFYRAQPLSQAVKTSLEKYRIAFEKIPVKELYGFDDMVRLYISDIENYAAYPSIETKHPIFITSDFISHTKHVLFDESLQLAEQNYFIPKLENFIDYFLAVLKKVNTAESKITASAETLQKALDYFTVAKALIELAPTEKEAENYFEETSYIEKDKTAILEKYNESVKKEIALIEAANGIQPSPLFSFADGSSNREDYSQYKVRGHYTKNPILATYFKVMMWFGRTNFIISEGSNQGTVPVSTVDELTKNMLPVAMLITELVNQDSNLLQTWKNIFDPITALIGISDDLSFYECLPLWKNLGVTDLAAWSGDTKKISAFVKLASEKLRPPAISGSSLFQAASAGTATDRKPPMGFRLFGQRYTLDSFIFHETSAPRMQDVDEQGVAVGRNMVSTLDVLTVLGSKRANLQLADSYKTFEKLPTVLNAFKKAIERNGAGKAFGKTYYGSVLQEIATIANFESGAGFYFTETPYWDLKQLNTGVGVYAELKHDTILYTKQAAAEMGGGSRCTKRTKAIPSLISYVEPNQPYFESVIMSLSFLHEIYRAYDLAEYNTLEYIQKFTDQCKKLLKIVQLEIQNKPVDKELLAEIKRTPGILASCMQFKNYHDTFTETKNTAIIADVFTNAETGQVLELGTGIPYRIYVALNDGQGGKRIAVGYCFNAYEFTQAMDERLTDEQWREKVYRNAVDLYTFKPNWLEPVYFED